MKFVVLFLFGLSAHAACDQSFENLQKKMLVDYIYKYPFNFGNEIQVRKVETVACSTGNASRYLVTYRDVLCMDLNDPERDTYTCNEVLCKSEGQVSVHGQINFDLAKRTACQYL